MKKAYKRGKNRAKMEIALASHSVHLAYTVALPKRADLVARRLHLFAAIFKELFADENLVTLLRAESITMVPAYLQPFLTGGKACQ